MSTRQQKSSRSWCLGRKRGEKGGSSHRKLRRQLRKDANRAIKTNDMTLAKKTLELTKQAAAYGRNLISKIRRNASRGT